MPTAKTLPCQMCLGCNNYEYRKQSHKHYCADAGSFTNSNKCGQNPDKEGTSSTCKKFKPK